jgi:hypothetical protein
MCALANRRRVGALGARRSEQYRYRANTQGTLWACRLRTSLSPSMSPSLSRKLSAEFWNMWNGAHTARIRAFLEHPARKYAWLSRHFETGGVTIDSELWNRETRCAMMFQ